MKDSIEKSDSYLLERSWSTGHPGQRLTAGRCLNLPAHGLRHDGILGLVGLAKHADLTQPHGPAAARIPLEGLPLGWGALRRNGGGGEILGRRERGYPHQVFKLVAAVLLPGVLGHELHQGAGMMT